MSALTNLWRQLIERRLWPVAILLIAALAAVPITLAKQPVSDPPPPAVKIDAKNELAQTPIVALAGAGDRATRRHVLGDAKNPFKAPVVPKAPTVASGTTPSSSGTTASGSTGAGTTSPGSSGTPTGGTTPTTPAVPTPKPAPKVYALHSLTVRFGDAASASLPSRTLTRLQPLPSAEAPVLIYLGVLSDDKTAVFLVDHGITATGDGTCKPDPGTCETIQMRAGDTEFFDVTGADGVAGAQYELDLIKIHTGATTSTHRAKASYAGSKAGRRLMRARVAKDGPIRYVWNAETGTLEKRAVMRGRVIVVHAALRHP